MQSKDFIGKLLVTSQRERLGSDECIEHPWIAEACKYLYFFMHRFSLSFSHLLGPRLASEYLTLTNSDDLKRQCQFYSTHDITVFLLRNKGLSFY